VLLHVTFNEAEKIKDHGVAGKKYQNGDRMSAYIFELNYWTDHKMTAAPTFTNFSLTDTISVN
jgi:hypothetical protein